MAGKVDMTIVKQLHKEAQADREKSVSLTGEKALLTVILAELKRIAKSQRNPQWLSTASAAARCDYSEDTFREYAKEYQILRHGPKLNRYDREEIDQWMKDPSCFLHNTKLAGKSGASYKAKMVRHLTSYISSGIRR